MSRRGLPQVVRVGLELTDGMNFYPAVTPQVKIENVEHKGILYHRFLFTSLHGTYVETRRHVKSVFGDNGTWAADGFRARGQAYDLFRAVVVHVKVKPGEAVDVSQIEKGLKLLREGDAFIVDFNNYTPDHLSFDERYNLNAPYFTAEAMAAINKRKPLLLGGNTPSFSNPREDERKPCGKEFGIKQIIQFFSLSPNNMVLAPLTNLREVRETVVALKVNPLPIQETCGVPCSPEIYQGWKGRQELRYLEELAG